MTEGIKPEASGLDTIELNVADQIKALPGKTGFYYENLVTGERAAYHEEERMIGSQRHQAVCDDRGIYKV